MSKILTRNCELCGVEFNYPDLKFNNNRRFCSGTCAKRNNGSHNKGCKRTEKFKSDMSLRMTGEGNNFYGKHHTQEMRDKCGPSTEYFLKLAKHCVITGFQRDIFDGYIISDGHISDESTLCARITVGFKYKETVDRLIHDLFCLDFMTPWKYENKDKRTNKTYVAYYTKSKNYLELKSEYNRWYKNGVKIIPHGIILTPLLCYWWYIGDGYLSSGRCYLSTNCFSIEDLNILKDKFKDIGFKCTIIKENKLSFSTESSIRFLDWMRNDKNVNIQKEYLYKWDRNKWKQKNVF
jgi:hypothetical protein